MIHPVVVNPVLSPVVRVTDPVRWRAGKLAPDGAILYWDADIDAFSEQTGGPHTFNHAVLSPQYQRNADGSYTDVGAKPAVDVLGGEKWLRSCGAVTNLLPSGSEDFLASAGWTITSNITNNPTTIGSVPSRRLTVINTGERAYIGRLQPSFRSAPFFSVLVKKGNCDWVYFGFNTSGDHGLWFNLATGVVGSAIGTAIGSIEALGGGVFRLHIWSSTAYTDFIASPPRPCNGDGLFTVTAGQYVDVAQFQLTATSYPVPYVPPGVTQPASNATATNGMWFTLLDGSPLWKALTGSPLTLAMRVRMGVGSGDMANSSVLNVLTPDDVAARFLTIQKDGSGNLSAKLSDGTNTATVAMSAWNRNDILDFFPQVLTGGTQMRVGYKTKAATSITWGDAATYAGTFGPDAALKRLMVGYANAYPMWISRITSFPKQATDAEAMGALV